MTMYLAQVLPQPKGNISPGYLIALVLVVALVSLLRIYSAQKDKTSGMGAKKKGAKAEPSSIKTNVREESSSLNAEYKKISDFLNLTPQQSDFFIKLCTKNNVRKPLQLIKNTHALDEVFSATIAQLEAKTFDSKDVEVNKMNLYMIKEKIENAKRTAKNLKTTRSFQVAQEITLITRNTEQYPAFIAEVSEAGFVVKVPRDFSGNELRLPLLAKVAVFYQASNGQSYRFSTRVRRYISLLNENRLMLYHTDSVRPLPNRSHDRKSIQAPANFTHVTVGNIVNGKQTEHKFYPSGKEVMGTMTDISAGGCSIMSRSPAKEGEYIEIKCILAGTSEDIMIGKVVRTHKDDPNGPTIMHIRFAKMSRTSMNRIFAYIYNYGEKRK